jgi:hypothetical protein
VRPDDEIVRKRSCDAFLETTLEQVLRESGIDRLIITGCATDYCVDTTVRSALARGWPTVAPSDGHTTVDRPAFGGRPHHRPSQRDLGRFPGARGPGAGLPVRRGFIPVTGRSNRLAAAMTAWLKQRFSDKETRGRAEVAPLARHRRSVA